MEQSDIESRVATLEHELDEAKEKIEALVIANNAFRTAMLGRSDPPTADQIYLARSRNTWASFDVSVLMSFYELFSAHTQIFTDLIVQKKGRNAIADHLLAKAAANAAEVKAFNAKGVEAKEKREKKVSTILTTNNGTVVEVSEADKAKRKALQGLMKSLNLTETAARAMLDGMAK